MLFHIKGILHLELPYEQFLFSACMLPPFFFLSGTLFNERDSFRSFIIKKTNRLLIPFGFFYLLSAVILPNILHFFLGMDFETIVGWPSLWAFVFPGKYPNFPLWFLWSLFLMNIFFRALYSLCNWKVPHFLRTALFGLCLCCAIVGTIAENVFSSDVACLFKTLDNIPFFCMGFMCKSMIKNEIRQTSIIKKAGIIIFSFLITLLSLLPDNHLGILVNTLVYILYGVSGSFLIITISAIIKYLPLVSYLGRFSIIILLTHGLLLRAGTPAVMRLSSYIGNHYAVILFWTAMMLSYLLLIPILRHAIPYFTAQKPIIKM